MLARLLRMLVLIELLGAAWIAVVLVAVAHWDARAALVAGIAAPLATHAAIVALHFGLAALAGSPTPVRFKLDVAAALGVYLREVADSFRVFQFAQPWLAGRPLAGEARGERRAGAPAPGSTAASRGIPVVLVHGYLCNRQVWRPLAAWLAARGHAIEGVDLEPVFGSIDDYVPLVARAVDAVRERTGAQRVAIVAHSMGGLAARAYLRAHADAPVACVVTLGTPHHGTVHARFGQGTNARQMRPGSAWLRSLGESESQALRRRFTVVYSHHDNIVVPQAIQTLPDARNVEFGGIGHLSLAFDSRVWRSVADALAHAARDGAQK